MRQGDVWWADFPTPVGSELGFARPVVVVQCDRFNASRIGTVLCVPLTTTLRLAEAPGNMLLSAEDTGLPSVSVANTSQITVINRTRLRDWVGTLPGAALMGVLDGICTVLGI
ncbi:MAG: type II toxin-antitoxin system PemK/MazF family toxin [Armatimonadetes bacterium]|nr:type II toxin-antitoxin system PemK/MazF family toxin [Armatimonadota bacterium]